jgi:hypothetical protein
VRVVSLEQYRRREWSTLEIAQIQGMQRLLRTRGIHTDIEWYHSDVGDPLAAFIEAEDRDAAWNLSKVGDVFAILDGDGYLCGKGTPLKLAIARAMFGGAPDPLKLYEATEQVIAGFQQRRA